ncbi:uncharacterized protein LOC127766354 [Oryza glaberrima]|uniref:uncharacterized protein LOC127766354 n=1 Tax=Oryza glaberrima TaxID=4538 RepID=UPI00224C0F48|nr:uncharacterized protein LOC127766354 [Oryza glaberrima]
MMEEDQPADEVVLLLPEEILAEILRRLPPRSLAASRCVCTDWRSTIDSRRLLRADLLPLSLAVIFIDFWGLRFPDFFSRPTSLTSPSTIGGKLDFLPVKKDLRSIYAITGHCNGLLMLPGVVVNPATRRWARLPPLPRHFTVPQGLFYNEFIIFDPTISPHYEVFKIPYGGTTDYVDRMDPVLKESEWPPSSLVLRVFSSATGQWDERSFTREGDATGTHADAQRQPWPWIQRGQAYWRGVLYVNTCHVMRISLSDGKYQVIKHPTVYYKKFKPNFLIGKSEKGVYLASLEFDHNLSIWVLNGSCGRFEWLLKHQNNLMPLLLRLNCGKQARRPWILQNVNYHLYCQKFPGEWNLYDWEYDPSHPDYQNDSDDDDSDEALDENNFKWNFDDDSVVDTQECFENYKSGSLDFLGFHPYKEMVFLGSSKGLAYHWNSTKLQYLGNLRPKHREYFVRNGNINRSFPYTPCWMDNFSETR